MPKFRVPVEIVLTYDIYAGTEDEAINIAIERAEAGDPPQFRGEGHITLNQLPEIVGPDESYDPSDNPTL